MEYEKRRLILSDGRETWFLNGVLHREDGPAVIYPNGTKAWYLNGKLHREDGPARIWHEGSEFWYLNGKLVTEHEHKMSIIDKDIEEMFEL